MLRLPTGLYRLRGNPAPETDYVFSELELKVDERPRTQPVALLIGRGSKLTFRVIDAQTGKGVPDFSFWWMREKGWRDDLGKISSRQGPFTTNQDGELRTVVLPGTRRYGLSSDQSLDYAKTDQADYNIGRELKLAAGEEATIEFKVHLRPAAEPPAFDEPALESNAPVAIAGRVIFDGPPPPPTIIGGQIGSVSRGARNGPPVFDDSVLVDPETRGLANVVIYFDRAPPGVSVPAAPKTQVALSVTDAGFEPRISVLRRGQTCVFTNLDPERLNVHIRPLANTSI